MNFGRALNRKLLAVVPADVFPRFSPQITHPTKNFPAAGSRSCVSSIYSTVKFLENPLLRPKVRVSQQEQTQGQKFQVEKELPTFICSCFRYSVSSNFLRIGGLII